MTKSIPLTQGKFALVDDEDFDWLNQWKWCLRTIKYAGRRDGDDFIYMHRQIMNCPVNMYIDHKNGNTFDNRKQNLRLCSASQNAMNRRKQINNHSGYKGVVYIRKRAKWKAKIKYGGRVIELGVYENVKEAAMAYNKAALELFGEFARLNEV